MYSIGWRAARRIDRVTLGFDHFDRNLLRSLHRSGSSYCGYAISYLLLQSDIFLVGILLGPTTAAVYGVAYKLMDSLVQLIWKIPDSLFPTIAELDIREGSKSLQSVHSLSGKLTTAVALLLAIPLALFGHACLSLWLGSDNAASQYLHRLRLHYGSQVLVHSSLAISYGQNRMRSMAEIALVEGGLKVVLAILLLPRIGMVGVAVSTVLAQLSLTTLVCSSQRMQADRRYFMVIFFKNNYLSVTSCDRGSTRWADALHHFCPWVQVFIGAPLSMAVYIAMYFHVCLSTEERQWLAGKMQSIPRWQKLVETRHET